MNNNILINPNEIVQFSKKPAQSFTREDIVRFVEARKISTIDFRYTAEDGKLKSLSFVLRDRDHLESILTTGERVDGSSLFSFIGSGSSDLYVIPKYRTAFVNPFAPTPTLEILCSFYDYQGKPLESSPEYILRKAHAHFKEKTGYGLKAFGELEYYVKSVHDDLYPLVEQKGYHQAKPFSKFEDLRTKALELCTRAGCSIKYGHSEVGSFTENGEDFEQHEIEFLPVDPEEAVDQLLVSKWILRMLAYQHKVEVSFAPKITVGEAGSGMHFHMLLEKNGQNVMIENEHLSDTAKRMIAGILDLSRALTAFGNTIPTSYLRLVTHQEAPVKICWGDRNRSALVRVPLGWNGAMNMIRDANPIDDTELPDVPTRQTVEIRSPDGSANIYMLLAGLLVAIERGLETPQSLEVAEKLYVDYNVFKDTKDRKKLESLPFSCWDSAQALIENRDIFEKDGIFPSGVIESVATRLKSFKDRGLRERLHNDKEETSKIVREFLHCG